MRSTDDCGCMTGQPTMHQYDPLLRTHTLTVGVELVAVLTRARVVKDLAVCGRERRAACHTERRADTHGAVTGARELTQRVGVSTCRQCDRIIYYSMKT